VVKLAHSTQKSRDIAVVILNLAARLELIFGATRRPVYPWERTLVPIVGVGVWWGFWAISTPVLRSYLLWFTNIGHQARNHKSSNASHSALLKPRSLALQKTKHFPNTSQIIVSGSYSFFCFAPIPQVLMFATLLLLNAINWKLTCSVFH